MGSSLDDQSKKARWASTGSATILVSEGTSCGSHQRFVLTVRSAMTRPRPGSKKGPSTSTRSGDSKMVRICQVTLSVTTPLEQRSRGLQTWVRTIGCTEIRYPSMMGSTGRLSIGGGRSSRGAGGAARALADVARTKSMNGYRMWPPSRRGADIRARPELPRGREEGAHPTLRKVALVAESRQRY
jgi:hypothetical protein